MSDILLLPPFLGNFLSGSKKNVTNAVAQSESDSAKATNASATIDDEFRGPDAEFVNKSVDRIREDAEAALEEDEDT